ncbi:DNA polymerase III subunit delta' [Aeromicrobium sp. 636]|uniref:DNA polymerase III subunit delta' n=1 Tax=Aeromicrobium senzhongii TaxID=2663859 RepID=A0A8I0EXG6_9ACTN|nr:MULTISPECIES: DNA polymerase III subunit delta' [Aeromicrobium]MBC9227147.1 DNA polymerase III subunit delta' [Aeromicrobium senzhongii]MCQ3999246.1 DNA polymerase III subunit delta' [Aeromicrobium sp. 636]MTB88446.1 DNA polymerase III subunit delta' [Aeromicrobium senzhongii]QNL94589.1 DNA polymerase III subunit delta' [Aeromicrobium senzhongii]
MTAPVWEELVGQDDVVGTLSAAVAGQMTHAWLFTGPPGSGRSNAAVAFATALQCERGGCGQCHSCVTAAAGSHPDIAIINTDGLSIGVDAARDAVRRAALHPSLGRYQVLVVEDADRLTDQAANALLKAIEEPAPGTVWLLCAPSVEDVITTIRSRCRPVLLRTPPASAIARLLHERDGIDPQVARKAAAAAQGHIGRARGLARDPEARRRRAEILALPVGLRGLGDCLRAAQRIDQEATARAKERCDVLDARELSNLQESWGVEERGRRPAGYAGALSSMTKEQERRRKRMARDAIDGVLLDLLSFQRDVLTVQLATGAEPINADVADDIADLAARKTPEETLAAIDAIVACREALQANAAPQLALEHMMSRFLG